MNEIQEQIRYFENLEMTYNERLNKSANNHVNELNLISRDMFRAGKEALQEKAERDKMRCCSCKHCITHRQNNDITCDNVSGLAFLKPNHFCSHFEPKENENG